MHTLKAGDGPVVADTATVFVCYMGVNGRDGSVFDSTYEQGAPMDFPLDGVVPGFQKAIAGQKVGSTVAVAMIPADGYPEGQPSAGIQPGDTLDLRDQDPRSLELRLSDRSHRRSARAGWSVSRRFDRLIAHVPNPLRVLACQRRHAQTSEQCRPTAGENSSTGRWQCATADTPPTAARTSRLSTSSPS